MSIKIEQGLFTNDFTDHHAILGVPVDADPKEIRKHYLKLARRLHPDSCSKESEQDRKRASEFLSKLVNPAYEKLSDEKNFTEYQLLLKLKGQQTLRQQDTVTLTGEPARKLASERGAIEAAYRKAVQELASEQYNHLEQTLRVTGQISELNMVYLMRKVSDGSGLETSSNRAATASATGAKPTAAKSTAAGPGGTVADATAKKGSPNRETILASYLRRAQEFENQNNFTAAIKELRDALQVSPLHAHTHTRLGGIYLKANQATMAKIHFRKALELNPDDTAAQQGLQRVDPQAAKAADATKASGKTAPKGGKPGGKSDGGGGLFGLFGGKKK